MTPFVQTLVAEVDLSDSLGEFEMAVKDGNYERALVLVRRRTVPLGLIRVEIAGRPPTESLMAAIDHQLRGTSHAERTADGALRERDLAHERGPHISVVVCTRNRLEMLRPCLARVAAQSYPRFDVIVVDNTAGDEAVAWLVNEMNGSVEIRYVVEPVAGLSRARNRGASAAAGEIVAFIDDDAIPDKFWLTELAAGYRAVPDAVAVNGGILPVAIDTPAQEWFLQYGGHAKGRGFEQHIFDPRQPGAQSPLYPLPPFGAGGNMSVRRDVLLGLGGFDEALGAGTPARGAEETAFFTHALLQQHLLVYRPGAFVWHRDRENLKDLHRQFADLGTSLTAYYTSLVLHDPRLAFRLAALLPRGIRDLRGKNGSARTASMSEAFPSSLLTSFRRGMLGGPPAYVRGRIANRKRSRASTVAHSR